MANVEKYIQFKHAGHSASGLTEVWNVVNIHHEEVTGEVRWYGAFRKYCFFPNTGFLFDSACLLLIANFLDGKNGEHRRVKKIANGKDV